MNLLKVSFDNVKMFKDGKVNIDFFASDRVLSDDESVHEIKKGLYANNAIAFAGINGSGKTIVLTLLRFALDILEGESIGRAIDNRKSFESLFNLPTRMNIFFRGNESFYVLSSLIKMPDSDSAYLPTESRLVFADEELYTVPKSLVTKAFVKHDFDEIISRANLLGTRASLDGSAANLISDYESFVKILGRTERPGLALFDSDYPFLNMGKTSEDLSTLLRAFDPAIEAVEAFDEGRVYKLDFADSDDSLITNREGIEEVLSSGTLKGLVVAQFALAVLRMGGYLLLDEIENHLNHQLVRLVLDLFLNSETNPHGATIVFTTHYAEVLDHLHRKDCIYFLPRVEKGKTEIVKYSSRVKRIEIKKSEVFASNYVKGTAPSFREMNALKEYVKRNV